MDAEVWKPVKGFEGLYEVSNLGRVKSLPRGTVHGIQGGDKKKTPDGIMKIREVTMNNKKQGWQTYLGIKLTKNGKHYHRMVHRLVAESFILNPHKYREVNHKDGNKHNNNVDNLEWVNSSYNKWHSRNILHRERLKKIRCVETGVVFDSIKSAKDWIGSGDVRGAVTGRCHSAGGFHWEYVKRKGE